METKKKSIKRIIAIVCAVLLFIAAVFYYTDPFEGFNNYEIPANPNDVVLCYYESDYGNEYYIITNDGMVRMAEYDDWLKRDYEKINSNKTKGVKIEPLTDKQLHKLTKMNPDNYRGFEFPSTVKEQFLPPRKIYYIVQKENDQFVIKMIWHINYKYHIESAIRNQFKCRSKYTNDICRYIDYAVDEARKAGL